MSWRVDLDDALDADLRVVTFELGTAACEAVHRFAERGEGTAYPVDIDASLWRIFVPGGFALVRADTEADVLRFLRIIPDHPLAHIAPLLDDPEGGEDD
jgi:hypothetical protein